MEVARHIDVDPDRCGGKPCVAGTRIRVWDIYIWHVLDGQTAEEIVHNYPQLNLAAVHAALSYFWEHEQEIRRQRKEADELVERIEAENGPGRLNSLRERRLPSDAIPPR